MSGSTDWLSATAMLLSGIIVGFMFIYSSMRKKQQAAAVSSEDLELRDLQARRDTLIQQLRDLEDVPANATERTRLEREASQVLRALDGKTRAAAVPATATPATGNPATPSLNPTVKGFLYGVGSIAILGFLGWVVYSSSIDKTAPQPNAMQPAPAPSQAARQSDPGVQQLEAQVASAPDNVDARINLAKAYLEKENMMGVFEQTQAVLAKSPTEPRALTYNALERMSMGQTDVAAKMLEQATKVDPKLTDAWVGLAWLNFQTGKADAGEKAMNEAMKQHPEQHERLAQILTEMR